ncbi:hypothetical protein ACHAWF_001771 [Thalassiosira exigua]
MEAPPAPRRRRCPVPWVAALLASVASLSLLVAWTGGGRGGGSFGRRRLRRRRRRPADFRDPRSVVSKGAASDPSPPASSAARNAVDADSRRRCRIVYVMGVEGATHHGFVPVLEALARAQVDPETGRAYEVYSEPKALKAGLFGWFRMSTMKKWGFRIRPPPEVDDPAFVKKVIENSCPDDGKTRVLIEWASFPSGHEDDPRSYRVHRRHEWLDMIPEEIAASDSARRHPSNMTAFVEAYSPLATVKVVVLHRPFLETIASHMSWDGGPLVHSNVIRGFMLILRDFLDKHQIDPLDGSRLWNLVCVDRIMAKHYENQDDVPVARANVLANLANFLGWPNGDCPDCFLRWRESSKDPAKYLGPKNVEILTEHVKLLEGRWPPPGEEGVVEQQCRV